MLNGIFIFIFIIKILFSACNYKKANSPDHPSLIKDRITRPEDPIKNKFLKNISFEYNYKLKPKTQINSFWLFKNYVSAQNISIETLKKFTLCNITRYACKKEISVGAIINAESENLNMRLIERSSYNTGKNIKTIKDAITSLTGKSKLNDIYTESEDDKSLSKKELKTKLKCTLTRIDQKRYDLTELYKMNRITAVIAGYCVWKWEVYYGKPCNDESECNLSDKNFWIVKKYLENQVLWLWNHSNIIAWMPSINIPQENGKIIHFRKFPKKMDMPYIRDVIKQNNYASKKGQNRYPDLKLTTIISAKKQKIKYLFSIFY